MSTRTLVAAVLAPYEERLRDAASRDFLRWREDFKNIDEPDLHGKVWAEMSDQDIAASAHAHIAQLFDLELRRIHMSVSAIKGKKIEKVSRDQAREAGFDSWTEERRAVAALGRQLWPFRALLTAEFAMGSGNRVTWAEATIDDHMQRVGMMQKQIDTMGIDVDLHEKAIALLRDRSRRTLGDLFREQGLIVDDEPEAES